MPFEIEMDKFERWMFSRFPEVRVRGAEYCIDSIFTPDRKKKLYVNPDKNAFHCWKTDESGSIPELIAKVDNCELGEAMSMMARHPGDVRGFDGALESLKKRVEKVRQESKRRATLMPESFREFRMGGKGPVYRGCLDYLLGRKLDPIKFGLGCCVEGIYKGGLLIPVFDRDGVLIYWTVRMRSGEDRYKNPPKDQFDVSKEDVIWAGKKWPEHGGVVFVTEGILDAMTLYLCGFPAVSLLGRVLSPRQRSILLSHNYSLVLAMDNDQEGRASEEIIHAEYTSHGGVVLGAITPVEVKDWNKLLQTKGADFIRSYVPGNIRQLDLKSKIQNLLADI